MKRWQKIVLAGGLVAVAILFALSAAAGVAFSARWLRLGAVKWLVIVVVV